VAWRKKWKNVATQTKTRKDTWSTEFLKAQPNDMENKRGSLHAEQVCVLYTKEDKVLQMSKSYDFMYFQVSQQFDLYKQITVIKIEILNFCCK